MLKWLKQALSGPLARTPVIPPGTPVADDEGAEIGGLNFMSAIEAHVCWKARLDSYIPGTNNEDLKVEVDCRDDACPLGTWIYSHGKDKFNHVELFQQMKDHHAAFHRCAGHVLATAQAGKKEEARPMVQREYVRASERVKVALARLFTQLAQDRSGAT